MHEHYKGLMEVWYCHKLFWTLSVIGRVVVIKISTADMTAFALDILIAGVSLC